MAWKMSFTRGQAARAAAGHHGRAETRALFAARNARADIQQALAFEIFGAADGVREVRIAAIDDDVAGFQVGQQQLDEFVHGRAGFDHEHDLAGPFQQAGHLLDGVGADDVGVAFGGVVQKVVDFGNGAIEGHHGIPVVAHIEDEVLAHDGQSD